MALTPRAERGLGWCPGAQGLAGWDTPQGPGLGGRACALSCCWSQGSYLTGNWVPRRGQGKSAHGFPLVAEPKNYTWRLSVWLGMGEEEQHPLFREHPKHFVIWQVVHRPGEWLKMATSTRVPPVGITGQGLVPRW